MPIAVCRDTIGLCSIDLDHWLEGFHDTEDSVRNTINTIRTHPLVPKDVNLYGYIIDSQTGTSDRSKIETE